jgi:hypothetical protein
MPREGNFPGLFCTFLGYINLIGSDAYNLYQLTNTQNGQHIKKTQKTDTLSIRQEPDATYYNEQSTSCDQNCTPPRGSKEPHFLDGARTCRQQTLGGARKR